MALRLSGFGVVGELELGFKAFPYLAVLSIGDNAINGSLPEDELLNLNHLQVSAPGH